MKYFFRFMCAGLCVLCCAVGADPVYGAKPPTSIFRRGGRVPVAQTRVSFQQVNRVGGKASMRVGPLAQTPVYVPQLLPNELVRRVVRSRAEKAVHAQVKKAVHPVKTGTPTPAVSVFKQQPFPGKEMIDGVIFDVDGVLLDSLPVWEHSTSNFLRSRGIEPPEGIDAEMAKLSLLNGAEIVKERYGFTESPEELLEEVLAPIRRHSYMDIQAKAGVIDLLKKLHAQGVKISAATAGDKELAQAAFERLGMMEYIDFVVSCDDVGIGKQSPAIYDAARDYMGTADERTLVVEDALHALQTAKEAGYLTAGVAEPFHPWKERQQVARAGDFFVLSFLGGTVISYLP